LEQNLNILYIYIYI